MPDAPEPPPRKFTLKPKEFERVNEPRPDSAAEATPTPASNDIFALQQEIRAREIASGMDELKPADRPQSTRRRRDYWLVLAVGNGAFAALAAFVGLNVMTVAFAVGGMVLFTLGLTWIMWVLVDRY